MVYTLPGRNAPNASFGNQLGQSLSQGFLSTAQPAIQQEYQRGRLQQALGQLKEKSQDPNASPQDLLYNLIEASSYSPEIGRNLPQLYAELNKAREANAMKNVNYGGPQERQETSQSDAKAGFQPGGISTPSNRENPEVQRAIQESRFFPNNQPGTQAPGNLPQEATSGKVKPVLSGDELLQKAQQRQAELARNGIVKTFEDVYKQVFNENEQNKSYNQHVENERIKRIESQEKYGKIAEELFKEKLPNSSSEEIAIFKKKGEEAAGENKSPGDIDRYLSKEIDQYKNTVSNIEKELEAPRIQNKIQRLFKGKTNDIKTAMQDARNAVKPLLDLGLYDKTRALLSGAGFDPEERETILFGEMPKEIKQQISSIPKAITKKPMGANVGGLEVVPGKYINQEPSYDVKSKVYLYDSLSNILAENPNVNILQLRKEYEDRGYDWRIFKDSLNDLVETGHIQLNPDQQNIFNSYLNNPPLSKMGSILHGLGIRGR